MTINKSPSIDQKKSDFGFQRHLVFLLVENLPVLGIHVLFPTILLRHVQLEKCNILPFVALILLLR